MVKSTFAVAINNEYECKIRRDEPDINPHRVIADSVKMYIDELCTGRTHDLYWRERSGMLIDLVKHEVGLTRSDVADLILVTPKVIGAQREHWLSEMARHINLCKKDPNESCKAEHDLLTNVLQHIALRDKCSISGLTKEDVLDILDEHHKSKKHKMRWWDVVMKTIEFTKFFATG